MLAFIALLFPFQESPNDPLEKLLEDKNQGALSRAIQARPTVGSVHPKIHKVKLGWTTMVKGKLMRIQVVLKKKAGSWTLKNLQARPETLKSDSGKGKKSARSPGQLWKDLLTALDKKAYERIPNMVREKSRDKIDPNSVDSDIQKEEEKTRGHFLEALRRCPAVREGSAPIRELELKFEYDCKDGEVSADIEFIKEGGEWKIKEIEIDLTE